MVLVDFKGGATFAGMSAMPHVSAVITNLADELTLVDRMQDALSGEMVRRQELLRDAGQLRLGARLRARADRRRAPRAAAVAVHRGRRVLRDAVGEAGVHRPLRRHRPARPVARPAPAARLAAAGGGPAARPRVAPVLPDRPAHLLRPGVAHGARRPRRLRAAADAGPGLPQARPVDAAAVQGGLRLGSTRPGARRRDEPAPCWRGSCPGRSPRCSSRPSGAGREPESRATSRTERRAGVAARRRGRPHGRPRTRGPPGLAAAARRPRHARRADGRPRATTPSSDWSRASGARSAG